ncbi:fimbrillin family protein [uncultured Bacteroides sp.]|uniref:fimbrillin family protein n=1 Tax=uncultured Bacteroides sp. TaxID=162156 RepID=UPI002AA92D0A|nr:fimbrillin family protein [uncultured Bacteroides sp.]
MKRMILASLPFLLLAGCSSDNEPQSGTKTEPVEIKLTGGIQSMEAGTRVPINSTLTEALPISIVRLDKTGDPLAYPDYTTLSSALPSTLNVGGGITFETPQYYPVDDKLTKLVGWYPVVSSEKFASGVVTFTVDGGTDIMLSNVSEGSTTSPLSSLAFSHLLTQIQIKAYAEDADTKTLWGNITAAINIKSQKPVCAVTLSSLTSDFSGSGDILMSQIPNALQTGSTNPTDCGYAMIPPVASSTQLQIEVTTGSGGTRTVNLPLQAYEASHAYAITLVFKTGIVASATIGSWETGTVTNPEIDVP